MNVTNLNVAVIAAVISACAAITAAAISGFIGLSLSKRASTMKLVEFRKEWIESLRTHLSEFHSLSFILTVLSRKLASLRDKNSEQASEINEELKDKYQRLRYVHSYIIMMLNPSESLHKQMLAQLDLTIEHMQNDEAEGKAKLDRIKFTDIARQILKAEWDRLKLETKSGK